MSHHYNSSFDPQFRNVYWFVVLLIWFLVVAFLDIVDGLKKGIFPEDNKELKVSYSFQYTFDKEIYLKIDNFHNYYYSVIHYVLLKQPELWQEKMYIANKKCWRKSIYCCLLNEGLPQQIVGMPANISVRWKIPLFHYSKRKIMVVKLHILFLFII